MTGKTYEVVDLFCGAGGSSTGAKRAIEEIGGRMSLRAVNHWNKAIATHSKNHPEALHIIEDVNVVNPEEVVPGRRLHLLMASPECKYHSRARGGKPIHDQGRMTAWAIHDWLDKLDVQSVLIENVPEFVDWGPVDPETDRPIKSKKGISFQAWFMTFQALGYDAEWRMLNAAGLRGRHHPHQVLPDSPEGRDANQVAGAHPRQERHGDVPRKAAVAGSQGDHQLGEPGPAPSWTTRST